MDLFTQIKMAISVKEAAEYYGLEVNRGNMVCCPFHADHTPSMKLNEDYFYCFGCGAHGDVIDFVARLFHLPPAEAAKKLAEDFGVAEQKPSVLVRLKRGKTQAEAERHCFGFCGITSASCRTGRSTVRRSRRMTLLTRVTWKRATCWSVLGICWIF